jgi:hypothetical protein
MKRKKTLSQLKKALNTIDSMYVDDSKFDSILSHYYIRLEQLIEDFEEDNRIYNTK